MASSQPPEIDEAPDADSRLESFLQQAATIIAIERGINARSRVKLGALAHQLGLPDDQFEHAIHSLQGPSRAADAQQNPEAEAFCLYLNARLEKLPRSILAAAAEAQALRIARKHFQLDEQQALDAVRRVTAERGIRRISHTEALRHIADVVAQKVGDAAWLDDQSAQRLRAAGREWGVPAAEVDTLIRRHTHANRKRQHKEHRTSILAITAAGVILVGLVGFVAWIALLGRPRAAVKPQPDDRPSADAASAVPAVGQRPKNAQPPKWWNTDLALAIAKSRAAIPPFAPVYERIASDDAAERAGGYDELVGLCGRAWDDQPTLELLRATVIGCYSLEPNDASAARLRDRLLAMLQVTGHELPIDAHAYERAFWATDVVLAALKHKDIPAPRAESLATAFGSKLGIAAGRASDFEEFQRSCYAALAQRMYGQLTAAAPVEPFLALQLHSAVSRSASSSLPLADLERLDTDFLVAALPAAGGSWQAYLDLINDCVASQDPLNVLKVLGVYERTRDPALQRYLSDLLILRVGATPKSRSVADVAAAIREALGATIPVAPATAQDRWQLVKTRAESALSAKPAAVGAAATRDANDKLLSDTVNLAYLATLACSVAQQEPGFALFDQLVDEGTPSLAEKKSEDSDVGSSRPTRDGSRAPITALQRDTLQRWTSNLANYASHSPLQRPSFLRGLADLADARVEIDAAQGSAVARYLLAQKAEPEHQAIVEPARRVARWTYVRLALADQLGDARVSKDQLRELLSAALHRDVNVDESGWQQKVHEQLRRDVVRDLATSVSTVKEDDAGQVYDRAGDALHELYRTRARAVGLTPAQYRATTSAAVALQLLVAHEAGQLTSASLRVNDQQFLARLPHELAVVEYLGTNDLRRTVLLQRIWLRLVAINITRRRGERAGQATSLVSALAERDVTAKDVLDQLKDGEATALQMWMLYGP
jgi:preprotein translocase subunit Sss1